MGLGDLGREGGFASGRSIGDGGSGGRFAGEKREEDREIGWEGEKKEERMKKCWMFCVINWGKEEKYRE